MKKLNDFIVVVLFISMVVLGASVTVSKFTDQEMEAGVYSGIIIIFLSTVVFGAWGKGEV